jgi:hypothetical protein
LATSQQSIVNPVKIHPRDLKRLARAASRVEHARPNGTRPIYDRGKWVAPALQVRTAEVTATITARSGSTLGRGQVKLWLLSAADPPVRSLDTEVIEVANDWAVSWATGKTVKLAWESGWWRVLVGDC